MSWARTLFQIPVGHPFNFAPSRPPRLHCLLTLEALGREARPDHDVPRSKIDCTVIAT